MACLRQINRTALAKRQLRSSLFIHSRCVQSGGGGGSLKDVKDPNDNPNLMTFKESVRNSNKLWNLGMKEGEYNEYFEASEGVFNAFEKVDEIYNEYENEFFPEFNELISGKREYYKPGYNNIKNPYNAWQCQCEILPYMW